MNSVFVLLPLLVGTAAVVTAAPVQNFVYETAVRLPQVKINGLSVKIHTQGLHVTDDHYWVTGRLETEPRSSLLLRFSRRQPARYEYVDITPRTEQLPGGVDGSTLDHPGGFDVDTEGNLLVPLSTSHARGPSLVYHLHVAQGAPLEELRKTVILVLDDHLGAIAIDRQKGHLLGANWDTKQIYRWSKTGQLLSRTERTKLFSGAPDWQLAVQDWKGLEDGIILAGGIDKSPTRRPADSQAVIQYLDLNRRRIVGSQRLPQLEDVTRPVTNEGLCWYRGKLFLLPEDIGRDAKILRYAPKEE